MGLLGMEGQVRHLACEVCENLVDVAYEIEKDDCTPGSLFFVPFSSRVGELEVWKK